MPKKIIKWEPENFELETTTHWSFKKRGDWATHDAGWRGNWSPYVERCTIFGGSFNKKPPCRAVFRLRVNLRLVVFDARIKPDAFRGNLQALRMVHRPHHIRKERGIVGA